MVLNHSALKVQRFYKWCGMKFLYDSIIQFSIFPLGISRWCSKYSCTISSVITPVLHAPYPTAQKCLPQYFFRNIGNSSCNILELRPFIRLTKSLTLSDGGYSTCMCMWSLLTTPFKMCTSSLLHTCTNMSRHLFWTSPVNTPYRYFVTHTIWQLRLLTLCVLFRYVDISAKVQLF